MTEEVTSTYPLFGGYDDDAKVGFASHSIRYFDTESPPFDKGGLQPTVNMVSLVIPSFTLVGGDGLWRGFNDAGVEI